MSFIVQAPGVGTVEAAWVSHCYNGEILMFKLNCLGGYLNELKYWNRTVKKCKQLFEYQHTTKVENSNVH